MIQDRRVNGRKTRHLRRAQYRAERLQAFTVETIRHIQAPIISWIEIIDEIAADPKRATAMIDQDMTRLETGADKKIEGGAPDGDT